MKLIFISGSSSGLGRALAEEFLSIEENNVIGISRTCTIDHSRYSHIKMDLSHVEEYSSFKFPSVEGYSEVIFINNAGTVSPVSPVGNLNSADVENSYQINLLAPIYFINELSKVSREASIPIYILNISSGAADYPIEGWSVYCSTKAALNAFSAVVYEEAKSSDFFIRCLSPGIIDTPMQEHIRSLSDKEFKEVSRFKAYKKQDELQSPEETAKKIMRNFKGLYTSTKVSISLREY